MREILGKLKEMWLLDIGQRQFIFTHPEKALIVEDNDEYKKFLSWMPAHMGTRDFIKVEFIHFFKIFLNPFFFFNYYYFYSCSKNMVYDTVPIEQL